MISKFTLDNGIRVVSENIPYAHSVSIGIWVASGSRHERRESAGIAHLIEHMLFKGTDRRNSLDISREIDSVGGVLNAFTSREYVCYYAKVLHKFLPQAIDLLADIFLNAVMAEEDLEKERNVILQEIGMLDDTPDDVIHDLFCRTFWGDHPMGRSILGTEESVAGITREMALAFKRDNYRGEDIIIAVAGKIDQVDLRALVSPYFSSIPGGKGESFLPANGYRRGSELLERELEQVHLCLGMPALPQAHPQRFAGYILNTILGGGMSSRLFQEIREKQGLAYSVYSYLSAYSDTASMVIYAGTGEERVMEVLDIIFRELRRLKTEKVTQVELDSAREQFKGNLLLSLESSDNRMAKIAKNELYFGRVVPIEEITDGFDRVVASDLVDLAAELLDDSASTLVLMGRLGGLSLPRESYGF